MTPDTIKNNEVITLILGNNHIFTFFFPINKLKLTFVDSFSLELIFSEYIVPIYSEVEKKNVEYFVCVIQRAQSKLHIPCHVHVFSRPPKSTVLLLCRTVLQISFLSSSGIQRETCHNRITCTNSLVSSLIIAVFIVECIYYLLQLLNV